jgi:hypothetical protein
LPWHRNVHRWIVLSRICASTEARTHQFGKRRVQRCVPRVLDKLERSLLRLQTTSKPPYLPSSTRFAFSHCRRTGKKKGTVVQPAPASQNIKARFSPCLHFTFPKAYTEFKKVNNCFCSLELRPRKPLLASGASPIHPCPNVEWLSRVWKGRCGDSGSARARERRYGSPGGANKGPRPLHRL